MISSTAESALALALEWLREVVHIQPFGSITVEITMQNGQIITIKKGIVETTKP